MKCRRKGCKTILIKKNTGVYCFVHEKKIAMEECGLDPQNEFRRKKVKEIRVSNWYKNKRVLEHMFETLDRDKCEIRMRRNGENKRIYAVYKVR